MRFRRKAAKNVAVGELVDIMGQYGWGYAWAAPVEKITHPHQGPLKGTVVITVAQPPRTAKPLTRAERTIVCRPRQFVHTWEPE